ncbi:MAG: class I SAM-dependent methyltransferase [Cyanothece sp. SIO1E1]|nr:class I SAM-dependent methyltransferase [Cyanothece sp. SIO1E1]
MRNRDNWQPSRFVFDGNGQVHVNKDTNEVLIASRFIVEATARIYQKYLPQHASGKLIDLGCGKVPFYELYKDYVEDIICLDWGNSHHKNLYTDIEADLTKQLPLDAACCNTILLSDVLEHLPDPLKFWHEMNRILVAEGKVILNVPFYYWLHEVPYDYYRYTRHGLERMATNAGFEVLVCEEVEGVPGVMVDLVSKSMMILKLPCVNFWISTINRLAISLQDTKPWRFLKYTTMSHLPLGYFMVAIKK